MLPVCPHTYMFDRVNHVRIRVGVTENTEKHEHRGVQRSTAIYIVHRLSEVYVRSNLILASLYRGQVAPSVKMTVDFSLSCYSYIQRLEIGGLHVVVGSASSTGITNYIDLDTRVASAVNLATTELKQTVGRTNSQMQAPRK
jgi:hypothetical protein